MNTHTEHPTYTRSVTGKVVAAKRDGSSQYGNPFYLVTIVNTSTGYGEIFKTSANVGLSYEITNANFRDEVHTFELNKSWRLSGRYYLTGDAS
jgi:hypothetical protein